MKKPLTHEELDKMNAYWISCCGGTATAPTSSRGATPRRSTILWRRPIAPLNYLLTSHVWRHDHYGFRQQDPGFIDHIVN